MELRAVSAANDWLGVHNEQTELRQENEILNHAVLALQAEVAALRDQRAALRTRLARMAGALGTLHAAMTDSTHALNRDAGQWMRARSSWLDVIDAALAADDDAGAPR